MTPCFAINGFGQRISCQRIRGADLTDWQRIERIWGTDEQPAQGEIEVYGAQIGSNESLRSRRHVCLLARMRN